MVPSSQVTAIRTWPWVERKATLRFPNKLQVGSKNMTWPECVLDFKAHTFRQPCTVSSSTSLLSMRLTATTLWTWLEWKARSCTWKRERNQNALTSERPHL